MITKMEHVATTKQSYPFISANFKCRLHELGYVEDEYFMSGTANVYEGDGERIAYADAPYTTRLLVRRPVDPARFSGNVVIEILNASALMDIDRMWVNSWPYMTRNGDIYIGITSKGHVVEALKMFDPDRYAAINWSNPTPEREYPEEIRNSRFGFLPQFESGLFWDMQVDLAKLLRKDDPLNPIREYGRNYLYLLGWSQSGSYITRIVRSFAFLPENTEEGPLFDGYLAAGCGNQLAPINSYARPHMFDSDYPCVPQGSMMGAPVPYININTESENRSCNWVGDFDQPAYKFRTYQIPGSSHDSYDNLIEYYKGQGDADCRRIGKGLTYDGVDGEPMDAPYQYVFSAALRNLYVWVREGVPAPHAPKIETETVAECNADTFGAALRNCTDAFGNAKGGIRTPVVDYPVAQYVNWSTEASGKINAMFGKAIPFSADKLKALYGSLDHYRELVTEATDAVIAKGFLLEGDRERYIEEVVKLAEKRGLQ